MATHEVSDCDETLSLMLVRDLCCTACGARYRQGGFGSVRCRHCGSETSELGATATGEDIAAGDQPWGSSDGIAEAWTTRSGQLSLIPQPTVAIVYEPGRLIYEDEAFYLGAFVASAPSLPGPVGIGSSEERAVAELATELRLTTRHRQIPGNALGSAAQLLIATRHLDLERLSAYLQNIATPTELATDYERCYLAG